MFARILTKEEKLMKDKEAMAREKARKERATRIKVSPAVLSSLSHWVSPPPPAYLFCNA